VPGRSSEFGELGGATEVEALMVDLPDMELVGILRGASNYTFLARLEPRPEGPLQVVYKPARGESPLWDFPNGTLYRREVAAYELSKALGWPRVPPTVVRRKGPHGVGAVQLYIEADRRHFLGEQTGHRDTWIQVSLFDVITNNADRKSGHCLFDTEDRVWVIDHGLTFHTDQKLRTVIWDFAGQRIPSDLCGDVERTLALLERGDLTGLERLLSQAEVRTLKRRLRSVLAPEWRFPDPSSAWSIPWPPV
jgi:hypothetical protein